jgi:hypothetical protein
VELTKRKFRQRIGLGLFLIAAIFIIPIGLIRLNTQADMLAWSVSVIEEFIIGIFSIAFTLIVIDPILDRFQSTIDSEAEEKKLKEDLIWKLRTRLDGVAAQASEQLQRHNWVRDGSLKDLVIANANLNNVQLLGANLQGSVLEGSKLKNADLRSANLEEASLDEADLRGADLSGANLHFATLQGANLAGAFLDGADLRGAFLENANLTNATLYGVKLGWSINSDDYSILPAAKFDEETILPDGSRWNPEIDMHRFTDPQHSEYIETHSVEL